MVKLRCWLRTVLLIAIGLSWFPGAWADLSDGLVAYYPFNGNANDESGNGNHGTVNGATLTEDLFENAESAYSFDGTNSFIEVMDTPALRLNNTDFTVSAWVYETERNVSYQDAILTKRSSGSRNGWFYSIRGNAGGYYTIRCIILECFWWG